MKEDGKTFGKGKDKEKVSKDDTELIRLTHITD